jgi:hypothetical protein
MADNLKARPLAVEATSSQYPTSRTAP